MKNMTGRLKQMLAMGLLFMSPALSNAQGLYVTLGGGYGFGANSYLLGSQTVTTNTGSINTTSEKVLNVSLGQGINLGGSAGYMLNEHVGVELGVGYLLGSKILVNENTDITSTSTDHFTFNYQTRSLRLMPVLKICGGGELLNPYVKFGMVIGLMNSSMVYNDREGTSSGITNTTKSETKMTGNNSFGFTASAGVSYKITDNISVFGECMLLAQSLSFSKAEITKMELNGNDILPSMSVRNKQTTFSKDFTRDNSGTPDSTVPDKQPAFSLPFSSVGFNLGVHYAFNQ